LGSGRHPCCCGRRHANADTYCYSDGDRHAQCHRNRIGNGYAATDANTQSGAIGKAAPNASAEAIKFAEPRLFL
jgi:hypothetical protein